MATNQAKSRQQEPSRPLQNSGYEQHTQAPLTDDQVVISGLAGRFPECDNVEELRQRLFRGDDLITCDDRRWSIDHPEIPSRIGKIDGLEKFDASFFGVHFKQGHTLDPMCRMLLERAYEAIVDAGINPRSLRGKRMGVYVGACYSESEKTMFYEKLQLSGFGVTGCSRAMLANRISYWLGIKGPSVSMDTACSSSTFAFCEAVNAIRNGDIDCALVGGTNLVLHPFISLQFMRLGVLSVQGQCCPFDDGASGYVRSEAVAAVFLQRAKDARRVYASVVHAAVNCDGYKEQGITYPSGQAQAELMRDTCRAAGVDPGSLAYVEAHATGTRVGDPEELSALDKVYCLEPERKEPLLVGSIKSNMGHTEPVSGLCSLAKVIIAMEDGVIPPTINVKCPRRSVAALKEGRLKVVTEPTQWNGGLVAVNSFGFGGTNAHVLLRSLPRDAAPQPPAGAAGDANVDASLPRLVLASGRTREAVDVLLDAVTRTNPPHPGLVQLLHAVHETNTPGHIYRGFVVAGAPPNSPAPPVPGDSKAVGVRDAQHWSGERRPVWFVFAGMGSQWPAMGAALMRLPVFAAAVQRCQRVLAPRGIDILAVLTSKDPAVLDDILNCFVGIATVQVGMVNVLRAVGIEPDVIIGHSVGELGCAYADGCLSAEQTVLAAYSRGRASKEAKLIPGAMAAVGLSAAEVAPLCPADVDVACHNGPDSATISGPAASLRAFVGSLRARGVFAKEVACGGIAYHSRYIAPAGQLLLRYLKEVIPEPKPRSERWLSSSVPESAWGAAEAQLCSAEYQTNNLLRSVLFEPLLSRVPDYAVAIEIAPHGLLQAILKRALPPETLSVPLARRGSDSLLHMLAAIGRLYCAGLQPVPAALYPAPQWPVPRGTPMISPLVRWAHSEDWFVSSFRLRNKVDSAERQVCIYSNDDMCDVMEGHIIDGRPLIPATGYLKIVWQTLANLEGMLDTETPVVFEDVRFLRATHLPQHEADSLELMVNVHRGSGQWEVSDKGTVVACGRVREVADARTEMIAPPLQPRGARPAPADAEADATITTAPSRGTDNDFQDDGQDDQTESEAPRATPAVGEEVPDFDMSAKHVYKCLRLRGYNYKDLYRGILSASPDGKRALIHWKLSWVPFLDALLQMKILSNDSTQLYVPTSIQKLVLDPIRHHTMVNAMPPNRRVFEAQMVPELDLITTGTVEIRGLVATPVARRRTLADPVLEHCAFVPYDGAGAGEREWEAAEAARVCVQLAQENRAPVTRSSPPVRVTELLSAGRQPLAPLVLAALADLPLIQAKATVFLQEGVEVPEESALGGASTADAANIGSERDVALLVLSATGDELRSPDQLTNFAASLGPGGCLVIRQLAGAAAPPGAATALRAAAAVAGLQLALRLRIRGGEELVVFRKGGWRADPAQLRVVRVPELAQEGADAEGFAWVERLQAALKDPNPAEKRVVLVARGALNGALGLFNCLRQEPGAGPQLARLYLLPEESDGEDVQGGEWDASALLKRFRPQLELDLAVNVVQGGRWGCMRHLPLPATLSVPSRHAYGNTAQRGDLSSFDWFQGRIDPDRPLLPPQHQLVHVHYAALNFRDVMLATGKLDAELLPNSNPDCVLGFEFSGRLPNGRRVMGMRMGGTISTEVFADNRFLWDVPDDWTLLQAATMPVAYSTVVYALEMVGRMAPGESVLVHAASGAVGQAALTLAFARGCRVFATVGTAHKRDFLLQAFPQLSPEDIGSSRDVSFEPLVLTRTGGRGVDLVLNSLADDKLQASLRCLSAGGRFLEIGKVDMFNNSAIGMRLLLKRASVHGIILDELLADTNNPQGAELRKRVNALLKEGIACHIQAEVFARNQLEQAYRHMAAGKHVGKVVIAIRESEPERGLTLSQPLSLPARPRFYCQEDASYVIVGGLGGLGLELAHWLVERGAKCLVLVSRRGVTTGYQARRLQQWRAKGVRALVRTDDTSTHVGAEALLSAAAAVAPVAAIFNLAVVLRDALFENQSPAAFAESFRCKATAAVQLDSASRRLCPRLRHFVLFSSVSCGRGNAGQTNYGLANAVMERVARERRAAGLPATAVQWGAVGDVGLVADMRDDDRVLEIGGTLQQRLSSCLEVLDGFLAQPHAVVSSMVVAEKRAGVAGEDLVSAVALLLGFRDLKELSLESSLAELGMDSMMAVEIQQTLAREFDMILAPEDVRTLTFGRLREIQRAREAREKKARAAPSSTAELAKESTNSSPPEALLSASFSSANATSNATAHHGEATPKEAWATESLRMMVGAFADELTASRTVVPLTSDVDKEMLIKDTVAIIFPGAEGIATALEPLGKGLSIKSVALQLPFKAIDFSVPAIVNELFPHLTTHVGGANMCTPNGYVLVGYSYGGLLALEAAARLEAENGGCEGMGRLILLDTSPQIMRTMAKMLVLAGADSALTGFKDADSTTQKTNDAPMEAETFDGQILQEEILVYLLHRVLPDLSTAQRQNIRNELREQKDWKARLLMFTKLTPHIKYSAEYKMAALDAIYQRILSALRYEWPAERPRLQASVTLIRPSAGILPPGLVPEDGGLSQICERPVRVHYVADADHYTLPSKRQTAALINAALEESQQDILSNFSAFMNTSECDEYRGLKSLA